MGVDFVHIVLDTITMSSSKACILLYQLLYGSVAQSNSFTQMVFIYPERGVSWVGQFYLRFIILPCATHSITGRKCHLQGVISSKTGLALGDVSLIEVYTTIVSGCENMSCRNERHVVESGLI